MFKTGTNLDFATRAVHGGAATTDAGSTWNNSTMSEPFASDPFVVGKSAPPAGPPHIPAEESLCPVVSHDWVNAEYKHLVVEASPKALSVTPGQFFNLLCPSPDVGELFFRRPQSVYRVNRKRGRIEFLYKCVGRGTRGLSLLEKGDALNMVGPLGVGFRLDPAWRHIVVLGRGVGIATLGPISQLARDNNVGVTAILSARDADFIMADTFFREAGDVVSVLDTDGSSAVENVEKILADLIAQSRADAFFTCGSNRLFQLMKRLGKAHTIAGQVAMEQVMACGLGPCYVCVRTFDVNGKKVLRRVCIEGPVFDMQEAVGW
jgi:dihydroorotate dehydrogenase electron transfer subunit